MTVELGQTNYETEETHLSACCRLEFFQNTRIKEARRCTYGRLPADVQCARGKKERIKDSVRLEAVLSYWMLRKKCGDTVGFAFSL